MNRDRLGDLERVAGHIAEDSPGYAAGLVRRIRDARSLDELAERGRDRGRIVRMRSFFDREEARRTFEAVEA